MLIKQLILYIGIYNKRVGMEHKIIFILTREFQLVYFEETAGLYYIYFCEE